MSTAAGRVFSGLTFSRGMFVRNAATTVRRLNSVRSLALSSQLSARSKKPTGEEKEVNDEPIKFSTSKASHRVWNVDRSMGSNFKRPWWKVLPISLIFTGFLLWCAVREETDIDVKLEKQLYEHLPSSLPDEEEKEVQNKPT
ncbi:protein ccsmst1 [Acanthochromis polyacanthus]|uniref:protein ccsmst1 n=1 Tax=Acanthochromis polyacanthus TaxID=80966 RepID=UPI002234999D|nr:protein ccsmst1 [Acanthochromis polyacanthus]